jgi:hypothetical protein
MISWHSYTTSKVLPTFVGESSTTASRSYSSTRASGFDFAGRFVNDATGTSSRSDINSPTLTYFKTQGGATGGLYKLPDTYFGPPGPPAADLYERTGENANDGEAYEISTIVIQNSTIESHYGITRTSPLATIRQETTKTESYESGFRTTKTISAYGDDEGNTEGFSSFVWTTTVIGEGTSAKTTFEQTDVPATETIQEFKTREGTRTVTTTAGSPIEVTTYTALDGNIEVVAHTIVEATNAASFNSPQTETPVTQLVFAPTRFTLSFSEAYTKTLPVRHDSLSTKTVTTRSTISENHQTTTRGFSNESYRGWQASFETRPCPNRPEGVGRTIPMSFQRNHGFTVESQTIVNSTQETFETFLLDGVQITETRSIPNTVSEETTAFFVSGNFFTFSSQEWPGLLNRNVFPWTTIGDGARRYFNLPNSETTIISATSQLVTFGHTWSRTYKSAGSENVGSATEESVAKKIGQFFQKNINSQRRINTATAIAFQHSPFADHGLASPQLSFRTRNDHATVGAFMSDNAQHTWQANFGETRGNISQGVVGAVPLYPTFSGLITEGSDGWELCDSSEYTTVVGSRVGQNFSTTIAWQTVEGTSTKNSTSSGEFSLNTTLSVPFGVQNVSPTIAGGFATPNASRTLIMSPGVVLMTTYDASGSGTLSSSYSTGTTEAVAPVGPVPVTISSFISRVQGRGVFTQALLDNGLP